MIDTYNTLVTKQQRRHVSVRAFSDRPVSDTMIRDILNTARRAPTSSNRQTYSMIVVRDPETRKQLAVLAGNQAHINQCQVFVAYCADLTRVDLACQMHDAALVPGLELTLVSTVDAALVGMTANTAIESFGLGCVMVGAMRNHPKKVAELLGLPKGVYVVFGMSIGWPDPDNYPAQKPRLAEEAIIHYEKYDGSNAREQLEAYNGELADFYGTRNQHPDAFTGPIAKQLQHRRRPELRSTLEALGFS
ncbi:MAG: NADPH-dependent oxidoreductase, partial [Candidatus Promineifilaceae bacterium]